MLSLTSEQLAQITGSSSCPRHAVISGVSTDSRTAGKEDVFIALCGEKFDAHDFVSEVIASGCPLAIVSRLVEGVPEDQQILVSDPSDAYGKIGAYVRAQYKGIVIGLTGSSGKTTTKEELKFILSGFGKVYATKGNHNNFVGVPESLCNLDFDTDYAVIEMGMSAKGEISRLVSYVQPDIAIVTNVYPMHIEFFENYEGIAHAKAEIFEGLKSGGAAIINADTDFADILLAKAKEKTNRIYQFGKHFAPTVSFQTAVEGEHFVYNAWCVLKVLEALGLDLQKGADQIKNFGALDGRGRHHILNLSGQEGTFTLIDDSYSGQPEAMKLAICSLGKLQANGRKIAVLGKMAELGDFSKQKHIEIGKTVAQNKIDIVIGVCEEMKDMLAQVPSDMQKYYFENKEGVADFLLNQLLQKDDIVLIKGARYSSKLYQVTEELLKKGKV